MRIAQRLSTPRGLEFRYRWQNGGGYYVTVDGSLTSMQATLEPLVVGALSHAEAATGFGGSRKRSSIARRLTGAYAQGLDEITDFVEKMSESLGGTPNSWSFDVGRATHLGGHLKAFTTSLTTYHQGKLRPHQIAEECHTVIELLLRENLGANAKGRSFEGMVHLAFEGGLLDRALVAQLIELKNDRRDAKHKGQGISQAKMNELLPSIVAATHRLTWLFRK